MWWCDQNNFGDMGGGAFPGDFAPYIGTQGSSHTCINFPSRISSHSSLYAACVQWALNCLSWPLSLHAFPRLPLDSLCAFDLECPSPICVGPKTTHHQGLIQRSSSSQSFMTSTLTWQWPLPPLNSLDVFSFPYHVLLDIKPNFNLLKGRSYVSFLCPSLPLAQSFLLWVNHVSWTYTPSSH